MSNTISPDNSDNSQTELRDSVGRSAAMMSALVVISRITGFFRTWGQAWAIGVTVMASCYSIANNLPNQLYELVCAGMLTTAFLPVYVSAKKRSGIKGASKYTSNLLSIVLVLMGAVAVLGFIFAAQVVWTQSFTATEEFDFDLTVYFFRFFVIEVLLYALSTIFSGVLNAERDYLWGQAAPIFNNFVTTASFVLYALLATKNPTLGLIILALGNPLGVAIQVIVQIPPLKKHNISFSFHIDLKDPLLKDTVRIGAPSIVIMLMSFVTTSAMSTSALSVTATGASIIYYARLWYTLPYAILTVPITTAMFTELSASWAKNDTDTFKIGITDGLAQILFFMLPFTAYLIVFATPLISVLAAGSFSEEALRLTSSYLRAFSSCLPFYAVCMYLQKVASAMRKMALFAWASIFASVLQVLVLFTLTPIFGLNFVGYSSTLFHIAIDAVVLISLTRSLGGISFSELLRSCIKILILGFIGAVVGAAILWALNTWVGTCTGHTLRSIVYCVLGGVPALIVTYGAALALKMDEVRILRAPAEKILGMLKRKP